MNKFKYSIVMPCNNQQEQELTPELKKIGWDVNIKGSYIGGITTYGPTTNRAIYRLNYDKFYGNPGENHMVLEEYNKELFLALASQHSDEEFHIGEWVKSTNGVKWFNGEIRQIKKLDYREFGTKDFPCADCTTELDKYPNSCSTKNLTKATKEEIISHFQKQTKNQQVMTNKSRFTVNASSSKALKEAIINELKERGFKPHSAKTDSEFINNPDYCLTQMSGSNAKEYQVEEKGSNPANQTNPKDRHYELPGQWTEVFEAWEEYCKAPAKKKSKVFSIEYEGGNDYLHFNITQGDAIQVYTDETDAEENQGEDCENGEYLGEITKSQLEGVIAANKIKLGTWNTYDITVSTISIGCKANMAIEDFQTLLDIYNRINS